MREEFNEKLVKITQCESQRVCTTEEGREQRLDGQQKISFINQGEKW